MKRLIALLFLCQFWSVAFSVQSNVTFYVSGQGKDTNPGTLEKPFATPERARNAVREELKRNKSETFTVLFRQGSYMLTRSLELGISDSGNETRLILN